MAVIPLQESRRRAPTAPSTPVQAPDDAPPTTTGQSTDHSQGPKSTQPLTAEQQFVVAVREEIDGYLIQVKQLARLPLDEVFMTLAGITGRLAEIRINLVRTDSRRLTALRTREIDPLIEECDRQFRLWSRLQSVRATEAELTRGMP